MNVQHMKFGMLSAVLVVCTLMISTIDLSQNFVFAQNTTSTLLPSQLLHRTVHLHLLHQLLVIMMNHCQAMLTITVIATLMKLPVLLDLLTMTTTAKIVNHNKMQHQTMAIVYL